MANKMKEVAALFDVELEEKFNLKEAGGTVLIGDNRSYTLTKTGLYYLDDNEEFIASPRMVSRILTGDVEIVKLPWKPKNGDKVWTVSLYDGEALWNIFNKNNEFELSMYKNGFLFRSEEDVKAHKDEVLVKYEEIRKELQE